MSLAKCSHWPNGITMTHGADLYVHLQLDSINARRHPIFEHQNTYVKLQPWSKHPMDGMPNE